MKRLFKSLAWLTGIWLLCSFLGVMFNPSRAAMWTQSLMWGLLVSVILAPSLLFVLTAPSSSSDSTASAEKSFDDQAADSDEDWANYEESSLDR